MRTLRFYGDSDSVVTVHVTYKSATVFDGIIPAMQDGILFEINDVQLAHADCVPMTVSVSGGTLVMKEILINYQQTQNPIYNDQTKSRFRSAVDWNEKVSLFAELAVPPFSSSDLELLQSVDPDAWASQEQLLSEHNCSLTVYDANTWQMVAAGEFRHNVKIDGVSQIPARELTTQGAWHWTVYSGSVLCYDLMIAPAGWMRQIFQGKYQLPWVLMELLIRSISRDKFNNPASHTLDLGVGNGQIGQALRTHSYPGKLHGLDITKKESFLAQDYDEFVIADIRNVLPLRDSVYDIVICSNVFEKYSLAETDPPLDHNCLDEILRVMSQDAVFVFCVDRYNWSRFEKKLQQLTLMKKIHILNQRWDWHRDEIYMFPPNMMCVALIKI